MKLFFSYGHDQNEVIVLRLKTDLEQLGHSVWIDKSKIKSGDDWRRTITSGILDSEFMVSFASNHSVRNPGVCLDELMIAVSVKGAQVQTVLLEANVTPPSNTGYRQYIDMSDWRDRMGTSSFEDWYAHKLEEIIHVIESPETEQYVKEIEYLKEQLCPDLSTMKKDRLQQEYYCGREWLSDEVNRWIQNKAGNPILLIDGAPGVGKSSFMAHEFMFNPAVGAIIFCEWDQPSFNNLDSISRSLAFQLATKMPDYRLQLVNYLKSEQLRTGRDTFLPQNGESVFRRLFVQQLRSLVDGNRPVTLILIDGIDEITGDQNSRGRRKNAFAELINRDSSQLPRWIRFVITTRRDATVLSPLQSAALIHIEENSADNQQDLFQLLRHNLRNQADEAQISGIARRCAGNFLCATMICKSICEHGMELDEALSGSSGDLGIIYRGYFDRTFSDFSEYEEKYYIPLATLAVTEEAIPEGTLRRITGWSDRQMNQALKVLSPYLSNGRDCLSLYHKSIRDWLLTSEADDYMVDEADGIRLIADGCYQAYEADYQRMNSYEMRYLFPYLERIKDSRLMDARRNEQYGNVLFRCAKTEREGFRYESASEFAQMALEIYCTAERWKEALSCYLFLAEVEDLMVHLEESKEYCVRALESVKWEESNDLLKLAGDVKMRFAYVCFRQNQWNAAINGYDNAIELYDRCGQGQQVIAALTMKANVLRHASRADEALNCYHEIETSPLYKGLKADNPALYACILMNWGWALHNVGHSNQAVEKLVEVEDMIEKEQNLIPVKDIAQLFYLRSIELFSRADFASAEKYCQKALQYVQLAYGENAVEICSALNQLGAIAQKMNDHEKAIGYFKQSYEIRSNYYGEQNLATSISLRNYAKALLRRGHETDYPEVEESFLAVYKIRCKLCAHGNGAGWLAQIDVDLADYYGATGNYSVAKDYLSKAEDYYKECHQGVDIGTCRKLMGIILYSEGRIDEARKAFEDAERIHARYYDSNHPNFLELKEWIQKCQKKAEMLRQAGSSGMLGTP